MLEKSLRYAVSARRLFDLLVSEDDVRHWTGAEVEIDPEPGGEVRMWLAGWPEVVGEVLEVRTSERLVVRCAAVDWAGPLTSVIEIRDDTDGGSRLALRETGFGADDDLLRRRDWLWSHWLVRLAAIPG